LSNLERVGCFQIQVLHQNDARPVIA